MLSEKIKNLRKQQNFTQEALAERLGVSRQAITKWEAGGGKPDIENIEALAKLFGVSVDFLLSQSQSTEGENVSCTEFDVFGKEDFELHLQSVNTLEVSQGACEKVRIELRTDLPDKAYQLAKVKLENGKRNEIASIELALNKNYLCTATQEPLSRLEAKKHLWVKLALPKDFTNRLEIDADVDTLLVHDVTAPVHMEFDGKANTAKIRNCSGRLELTSNTDLQLYYDASMDQLDINQLLNLISNSQQIANIIHLIEKYF